MDIKTKKRPEHYKRKEKKTTTILAVMHCMALIIHHAAVYKYFPYVLCPWPCNDRVVVGPLYIVSSY